MTDHPMIFSAPMVNALTAGRKTQTRRILPPLKGATLADYVPTGRKSASGYEYLRLPREKIAEPMWRVGDLIWVREAWQYAPQKYCLCPQGSEPEPCDDWKEGIGCQSNRDGVVYRADHGGICRWRSPIYMARRDSRVTLTVVEVREQLVQEISEEDAIAEGMPFGFEHHPIAEVYDGNVGRMFCGKCGGWGTHGALGPNLGATEVDCSECDTAKKLFRNLWNSLHGPDAWDENPFVGALTFETALRNIDDASLRSAAA